MEYSKPLEKDDYAHFDTSLLKKYPFQVATHKLSTSERARVSYDRAKAICLSAAVSLEDIALLKPRFWEVHAHPVITMDGASATLLTIQYNLAIGTLTMYARRRRDLVPIMNDMLAFRTIGCFLVTEVAHGLDVERMETTATLLSSGEFILNTPSPDAAKYMPPTTPMGIPSKGIVFARLIVDGEDRGIRSFLVNLSDGVNMCPGVSSRLLPPRGGTNPINHALTTFNSVLLPRNALLGPPPDKPSPPLPVQMWRVAVGSLALCVSSPPALEVCATLGLYYSQRRKVTSHTGKLVPIFSFRTQQVPVAVATAQAYVARALARWATRAFADGDLDPRARHGIATVVKATLTQHALESTLAVSERLGAQGLFEYNQLSCIFNEMRGIAVAEGDILVLSIRLATELALERYELPAPMNPDSLLARHEAGLMDELRAVLASAETHRDERVARRSLPRCLPLIEAIGHRMAYDAATAAGVPPALVELYVARVVQRDAAWYAGHAGLSRAEQVEREENAADAVLERIEELVKAFDVRQYVTAPILDGVAWSAFVQGLPTFGQASVPGRAAAGPSMMSRL